MTEAVLLATVGSQATGSALYSVTGDREGGFIGVIALSALEGDGKSNIVFLLEPVFFLSWLGFLRRAAAPKYVVYLSKRQAVPAIVVLSVYYNCGR